MGSFLQKAFGFGGAKPMVVHVFFQSRIRYETSVVGIHIGSILANSQKGDLDPYWGGDDIIETESLRI